MILIRQNIHLGLGILLCVLFFGGCATLPVEETKWAPKEIYLKDICEENNVAWQWESVSQVVTLSKYNTKAKTLIGSEIVIVNGKKIVLSEPLKIVKSSIVVPPDFKRKVIDQFGLVKHVDIEDYSYSKINEIVIDAGHGGKDPGAIGRTGLYEKKVVLDIAKRLSKLLKKNGIKVIMTRNSDEFVSLKKRTQIASQSHADLFLSIHANANPVRSIHGVEVYTLKDLEYFEKNEDQRKKNEKSLFNKLKMKSSSKDLQNIVSDMLYIHKQAESEMLAKKIAQQTSRAVKTKNLGKKDARFFVLRNTLIPALLVEVGFLSNPKEEKKFKTSRYRQEIADALAETILDYGKRR